MKQALLDTLEWYAEATPQARLEDGGERAANLLMKMNEGGDEADMLTTLLERVNATLEDFAPALEPSLVNLEKSAMEWAD